MPTFVKKTRSNNEASPYEPPVILSNELREWWIEYGPGWLLAKLLQVPNLLRPKRELL